MSNKNDNSSDGMKPPSFANHLSSTKQKFLQQQQQHSLSQKINFIMGNEAGDADSIISSLAYSYVKSLDSKKDIMYVPVISIPSQDLHLRRETTLLFDLCGIPHQTDGKSNDMFFIDDASIEKHLDDRPKNDDDDNDSSLQITLVDHNRIKSSLSHLSDYVVEILDHHEDEGHHHYHYNDGDGGTEKEKLKTKREIAFENGKATVGSTCTLIAEGLFDTLGLLHANEVAAATTTKKIDYSLGLALLGVILIDTMNMNPKADKGTKRDEDIIHHLLKYTDWSNSAAASAAPASLSADKIKGIFSSSSSSKDINGPQPDCAALYEVLQSSKFDRTFWEQDMNVRDCLRIDYKRFQVTTSTTSPAVVAFGMSSVLLPMESLLYKKEGGIKTFYKQVQKYMKDMNVKLLLILSMTIVNNEPHREMVIVTLDDGEIDKDSKIVMDDITRYLLEDENATFLQCVEKKMDENEGMIDEGDDSDGNIAMKWFVQGNTKGSRKQVAPVIMKYVANSTIAKASL